MENMLLSCCLIVMHGETLHTLNTPVKMNFEPCVFIQISKEIHDLPT